VWLLVLSKGANVWKAGDESDHIFAETGNTTALPEQQPDTAKEAVNDAKPIVDFAGTFPVHVNIERAFHLPMVPEDR